MDSCIFCQIISGQLTAKKVQETDLVLAFRDINPKAPTHILIVPKEHQSRPSSIKPATLAEMFQTAASLAKDEGIDRSGYRLVFNIGKQAGQSVDHAHLHLLGGKAAQALY